jgi:O-antigen/teichoic acid export membrane protein
MPDIRLKISKFISSDTLRNRTLKGALFTFLLFGSSQFLRLASNLILTRILFPEAFGLMSLVSVVLMGLNMLSDVGVEQSIIQNKNSQNFEFRNTAWAIKICRGFFLWGTACVIAYPVSVVYDEPALFFVICVLGINFVVDGFTSTAITLANKDMEVAKISFYELSIQFISIAATILISLIKPDVWALVYGNLISSLIALHFSYKFFNDGFTHKFQMDKTYLSQILNFGKWIFVSSVVGFIVNQIDKIIIGKVWSIKELGIYTIAITFSQLPRTLLFSLHRLVLLPVYSEIQHDKSEFIRDKIVRSKLMIIVSLLPIAITLMIFGEDIIALLYDERYAGAGWMLQVMAAGAAILIVTNAGPYHIGFGDSRTFALTVSVKAIVLVFTITAFTVMWGKHGIVYGLAASELLYYFFEIFILRRFGFWIYKIDLPFLLFILVLSSYVLPINI